VRTTLRLDDDLFLALRRIAAERGVTLSVAVNSAVRVGLSAHHPPRRPFRQPTVDLGAPTIDLARANEAVAVMEDAGLQDAGVLRRARKT
jgi:hypothetical protein